MSGPSGAESMEGEVVESAGSLDAPAADALRSHLLTLADSKRLLGIRYSDWILGAPSIETAIAASAMAQDEWGHARLLYATLKDLGLDPMEVEHERPEEDYTSVDPLDGPFDDWAAFVAGVVLVDGALTVALEGLSRGRYDPARSRVPKMLSEEEFHTDFGEAWFRRLARGGAEGRGRLGEAVRSGLGRILAWLGPDDEGHRALVEAGLTEPAEALHRRFRGRCAPLLDPLGIDPASVEPERSGWDGGRRRGPGHPDADAVERARGDRNRALFVE